MTNFNHQTITVDVQPVKDNPQDLDNLHVVELLNGTFSISVCIQVGREESDPPVHAEVPSRALQNIRAPENRIKDTGQRGQKICCEVIAENLGIRNEYFSLHLCSITLALQGSQ